MIRFSLLVIALYGICCALAFGQPTPAGGDSAAAAPADPNAKPRTVVGPSHNGPPAIPHRGSLLKATMAPDSDRVKLTDLDLGAVPEPKPRLLKKRDLITIIVRQESQSQSTAKTDLKKSADLDAKVDSYVKLNLSKLSLDPKSPSVVPELKAEGTRNFKGEADVNRTDTFTAHIGAEIIDVKPNGNLVIQGKAHIKTDEEEQEFIITGTCRAEDVSADNSVISNQLHDLEVKKTVRGAAKDTTKRGFIPRLLDFINPF